MFKLYPWEWLLEEAFGVHLPACDTTLLEPPWKAVLSNKGMLAYLWQMFPDHPNLLPTYFADDPSIDRLGGNYVTKPLFSREGANVTFVADNKAQLSTGGTYGREGLVVQAYAPLPYFGQVYPVIGSWIANGRACGIGIREDETPVTQDSSRFVPHLIR